MTAYNLFCPLIKGECIGKNCICFENKETCKVTTKRDDKQEKIREQYCTYFKVNILEKIRLKG